MDILKLIKSYLKRGFATQEEKTALAGLIEKGFGAIGLETRMSPATAPAGGGTQITQVSVSAPVNVSVPAGTPAALVGESITEGIERVFGGMVRQASRSMPE